MQSVVTITGLATTRFEELRTDPCAPFEKLGEGFAEIVLDLKCCLYKGAINYQVQLMF